MARQASRRAHHDSARARGLVAPRGIPSPNSVMIFGKRDPLLERIAAGRTDLVFDYVANGNAATTRADDGTSLLYWCARYGDVSAMRFLLSHGATLDSISSMVDLEGAAFFRSEE